MRSEDLKLLLNALTKDELIDLVLDLRDLARSVISDEVLLNSIRYVMRRSVCNN